MSRTLYLDLSMGASGDMLTAALLGLFPDRDSLITKLNSLGLPKVIYTYRSVDKCGLDSVKVDVIIDSDIVEEEDLSHVRHVETSHYSDIVRLIQSLDIADKVKEDAISVYQHILQAEAQAHNCSPSDVHFHEVGSIDAVADVVAVSYLINELNPDNIIASPINVGSGTVKCAHGILDVPVPAVVNILSDISYYKSDVNMELCTPTGAALIKHFVDSFGVSPVLEKPITSFGAGYKDLELANVVRAYMGQQISQAKLVVELKTQVDDMTGEDIAFAAEQFLEHGAYDCYTNPVYMKKNRLGCEITVICSLEKKYSMIKLFFKNTSTIGVRESVCARHELDRRIEEYDTEYGPVRVKKSSGFGTYKSKLEYDDLSEIAVREDMSIMHLRDKLQ